MSTDVAPLRLEKYHGSGNDFLVLVDLDGSRPVGPERVRALCDRHRGVGADGLIRVVRGDTGAPYRMELYNADGGRAEMSGNGIRCLARALNDGGHESSSSFSVATDAGRRTVTLGQGGEITVDMGPARSAAAPSTGRGRREMAVDMGNPHVVVEVDDPAKVDLAEEAAIWGETNVEVVMAGPEPHAITLRVHERGVGETRACGTGACAAATAARDWGLVGDRVVVHQPGGDVIVDLTGPSITLTGPAVRVAGVEVDASWL